MKVSFVLIASCTATAWAAAVTSPTTEATMKFIMSGLHEVKYHFMHLDVAIHKFPETGTNGAKAIHEHEAAIHTLFGDLNTNLATLSRPISHENVKEIVKLYQSFTPTIVRSFNGIEAKAPSFVTFSAAETMKQDMILSSNQCKPFAQQLIAVTPPILTEAVSAMFDEIDVARNNAMVAFQ
ncbi:hypothetical protein JR316_0004188 [Psilocybe cubensis]|uniref:Uncharacterized protein n=1 Tax=Psilocybe cubensis TaxID=181762 RepID=A0ACB8H2G7_PSICU|nr:hypothetical protein JR316_0004188 [Psilocybe cubensis]KAH9482093.1 hypothetical protein JR316_0004188 [Psilocybe cubensis]